MSGASPFRVPDDCLVRNVEPLAMRKPFQIETGLFPREMRTDGFVVMEMWNGAPLLDGFADRCPSHVVTY